MGAIIGILLILSFIAVAIIVIIYLRKKCPPAVAVVEGSGTAKRRELLNNMKLLWTEHVYLIHNLIQEASCRGPGLPYVLSALMDNADQIGRNFGELVDSKSKGQKYAELLKEHVKIVREVIKSFRCGYDANVDRLYANADEISKFLANELVGGDKKIHDEIRKYMHNYLKATLDEIDAILNKKYNEIYLKLQIAYVQAIRMANYIHG